MTHNINPSIIGYHLHIFLILCGAFLLSVQLSEQVSLQFFSILVVVWLLVFISRLETIHMIGRMGTFLLTILCITISTFLLIPEILEQLTYFVIAAISLGLLHIVIPQYIRHTRNTNKPIKLYLRELVAERHLLWLWARYRIEARYSQTSLGILWIIALPIINTLVMTFALDYVLQAREVGTPWVVFLLSGQVLFNVFRTIVMSSTTSLSSSMELIQQVGFPREIIILLSVAETAIDLCFTFAALIIVSMLYGIHINIYFIYLPLLIALMFGLSIGVGLLLSWFSLIFEDFQQLTGVILQILFYLTVLYSSERVGDSLTFLPLINPLSALVEAFRSVVIYARPPAIMDLLATIVLTPTILYVSYTIFKANEERFADFS